MRGFESVREAIARFIKGSDPFNQAIENLVKDLQKALIKADVNVRIVFDLTRKIREDARKSQPPPGISRKDWFIKIVYDRLAELFGGDVQPSVAPPKQPYVILMVGVQGSGKTTTCGKLAYFYKKMGYSPCLIAADTYRPGAYDQLKQIAERVGVPIYGDPGEKDPVKIVEKGMRTLKENNRCNIIIIDTAGRHGYGSEESLLKEMREIADRSNPDEVMLVIDASIGQKAYDLAKRFHEATPIGSIIVTKLDGSAKGGGALSAVAATGARIKFIGVGEKIDELEVFNPRRFVGRLLGLGDIEGLIEKFKSLEEREELERMMRKALATGKITMVDLYHQIKSITKLGPLSRILQMIPGLSALPIMEDQVKLSEKKMRRWLNIMDSMTYDELKNPKIITRSRIVRIARGSGSSIDEVKELLRYYENINRFMRDARRKRKLLERLKGLEDLPEFG